MENSVAHESAVAVVVDEVTPQIVVHESGDGATQVTAVQENDEISAAKRAIIHEWENWSALNSDELGDPNVGEYFFRHLQTKKACLLDFISNNKQKTVFGLLLRNA